MNTLETVYYGFLRCHVVVEAPHRRHRTGRRYHVRVRLTVPGEELVVSRDPGRDEPHEDVYVAIRDSFHAARRRLEDYVRRNLRRDVKARAPSLRGRIDYLDLEREWGTLAAEDGRRIYFHRNSVIGDIDQLQVGDEVQFAEEPGEQGPQATTLRPIGVHGRHVMPPGPSGP
jgi:cold shock CspA family protein